MFCRIDDRGAGLPFQCNVIWWGIDFLENAGNLSSGCLEALLKRWVEVA